MFAQRQNHCSGHPNCQSPAELNSPRRGHNAPHAPGSRCQSCSGHRSFVSPQHGFPGRNGERIGYGREGTVIIGWPGALRRERPTKYIRTPESHADSASGTGRADAARRRPVMQRGAPWPHHGISDDGSSGLMDAQSILGGRELGIDGGYEYGYGRPIRGRGNQHQHPHSPLMTPAMSPGFRPRHPFLTPGIASPRSPLSESVRSDETLRLLRARIPEGLGRRANYRAPYVEDYESQLDAQERLGRPAGLRTIVPRGAGEEWYDDFDEEGQFDDGW